SCEGNTLRGQANGRLRVRDGCGDFATMADNPGVIKQPGDVGVIETRDHARVEARKRPSEAFAFSQDSKPGKTGLEPFEAELLEHPLIVADRQPPFAVVVGLVLGCRRSPPTPGYTVFADNKVAGHFSVTTAATCQLCPAMASSSSLAARAPAGSCGGRLGHQIRSPRSKLRAVTRMERTTSVSSSTPNATAKPICAN